MEVPAPGDFEYKFVVLLLCGQDALNEGMSGLEVIRLDGQLLDRVSIRQ